MLTRVHDNTPKPATVRPMLHLLPVLQVDPFDRVTREDITLSVLVSWQDEPVMVDPCWVIRQPYPNQLYFVGGSASCHLGHFIELPTGITSGEVTFHWSVNAAALPPGHFDVTHRLNLTFDKGAGHTWSMDVANWWAESGFASRERNVPEIGRNRFSRLKPEGISAARQVRHSAALRNGRRDLDLHEAMRLPEISLDDCWTVAAYGGDTAVDYLETLR